MLKKVDRLRRARDFALLSQKGRVVYAPFYALRLRQSSDAKTKVGFVASKKIFKTAVERNRVKRRMREVLRMLKSEWPKGFDLLFILKVPATKTDFGELQASVRRSFEKIPEAMSRPPAPKKPKARRKTSVVFHHDA